MTVSNSLITVLGRKFITKEQARQIAQEEALTADEIRTIATDVAQTVHENNKVDPLTEAEVTEIARGVAQTVHEENSSDSGGFTKAEVTEIARNVAQTVHEENKVDPLTKSEVTEIARNVAQTVHEENSSDGGGGLTREEVRRIVVEMSDHHLVIDGSRASGSTSYTFTAASIVKSSQGKATVNKGDTVRSLETGMEATGSVGGGVDAYTVKGEPVFTSFNGNAEVTLDGVVIDVSEDGSTTGMFDALV